MSRVCSFFSSAFFGPPSFCTIAFSLALLLMILFAFAMTLGILVQATKNEAMLATHPAEFLINHHALGSATTGNAMFFVKFTTRTTALPSIS